MGAKKWLNMSCRDGLLHSDGYASKDPIQRRRKSCSNDGVFVVVPEELSEEWLMGTTERFNCVSQPANDSLNLRIFVGTWNVGGRPPHDGLNLRDWLKTKASVDIYVLGFQEIVPLNAGNVLGPEDCGPASKWLALIRQVLNSEDHQVHHHQKIKPRVSFSDLLFLEDGLTEQSDFERFYDSRSDSEQPNKYCLVSCKQMVGIFLCVWVREDLYRHVNGVNVSCVGRGLMGYLGNKGSISISMRLHETSLCFVCTHLASGEKEGDVMRRNLDVMGILRRTRFSRHPFAILDHDKIIWLGDLNYRLASMCNDARQLLHRNDWQALLEKDELRLEKRAGRVFKGWEEGEINFAPTYKYITNSDRYVVQKRRTPAWCDRILWKGEGIEQMFYVRGESRFSDHRPVCSLFSVQVNLKKKKTTSETPHTTSPLHLLSESHFTSSSSDEDHLWLVTRRTQSRIQTAPRFSLTAYMLKQI